MKIKLALVAAATLGFAAPAFADDLSDEQLAQIDELMAAMRCEIAGDVEVEDGEIELDDVICAGGQFDIEMNMDLHITGARGE